MNLDALAKSLHALKKVDISVFQRRARILQSMWREECGFPCGEHLNHPLGSRLPMPWARETLQNFITEPIRQVVKTEVCNPQANTAGKLYGKPRIFNDLLSSQPLCFNLFGELKSDPNLISSVVNRLTSGRFPKVTDIDFEFSPGRGDPLYLGDRSAFDVFLKCRTATGGSGFIGIEVKYYENMRGKAADHRCRYDKVADLMGCFHDDMEALKFSPLQQIWRDHLLSGITRINGKFDDAMFVMLYPRDNKHVSNAINDYSHQLMNPDSFSAWTMEDFVNNLRRYSHAEWIDIFFNRYLAFEKIDNRLNTSG